jgi:uncharacterized integral membrane protein (TIGR00698 family)
MYWSYETALPKMAPPRNNRIAFMPRTSAITRLLPGLLLCIAVTLVSVVLEYVEAALLGRAYLEALVLAILVGTAVRSVWTPPARYKPGVAFGAKMLLEIAVVLLGASISAQAVLAVGPGLLVGIAGVVIVAIICSFSIGRMLGLPQRMALLVACGNSICGNSAIAAVAPVIHADSDDVAASIAFTAVLGVVVVLSLPLTISLLGLTLDQYGVLAGLTVYAVPQVLAATLPVGLVSTQIGTLVKLVRVLMLGPVVLVLSLLSGRLEAKPGVRPGAVPPRMKLSHVVPWFIVGFLLLMALRSANLLPAAVQAPVAQAAGVLTVVAMAALGLGVDVRVVARAGGRVTGAVVLSLVVLGGISLALIHLSGVV